LVVEPDSDGRALAADGIHSALIAVEEVAGALHTARLVSQLIEPRGRVVLIHVVPNDPDKPNPAPWLFELEVNVARLMGTVTVSATIERGDVGSAIVRCAQEMDADLVAVGSRPHHSLADRVFGTVADSVLAAGGRVVLAIPEAATVLARVEHGIDTTLDASFPASDPPSFSPI
jgi:nucleotide-binding universal stress UspA family protein